MQGIISVFVLLAATASVCGQATFTPLGDLPGGGYNSRANAISSDGAFVVGRSTSDHGDFEAFVWTALDGQVGLGHLDGVEVYSTATGVSTDGRVIVGRATSASGKEQAYRWTKETGMVSLGGLIEGGYSAAYDVSDDGAVIVGAAEGAFRWTAETGLVVLSDEPSIALAVSGDGRVIVGLIHGAAGFGSEPFRWTEDLGMQRLGYLPGHLVSEAWAVSGDGSVIGGVSVHPDGPTTVGWIWTEATGMVEAGDGIYFVPEEMTGDGRTMVGVGPGPGYYAAIWTPGSGVRDLKEFLAAEYGLEVPPDWTLEFGDYVSGGISEDGRRITGRGTNPEGNFRGWLVTLGDSCRPDCNHDGKLNINDFVCFQSQWRDKTAYGDFNGDGKWNINDFIAFQASFRKGCP